MLKRRSLIYLTLLFSLSSLVSCKENSNDDTAKNNENEDSELKIPTQSEKTQFYLKNRFNNLKRGMTLKLDEYIGVVPGFNEKNSVFKSYVLEGSSSTTIGYLKEGDGKGNSLFLIRPGKIRLRVECNGVNKLYILDVEESTNALEFINELSKINYNYTIESSDYKIYRDKKYIYNETLKNGYILSNKDDNYYSFTLDSKDSSDDNLELYRVPVGEKESYYSNFISLGDYANSTYWTYTELFSSTPEYKRFKYLLSYSSTVTKQYFKSLGLLDSYYKIGSNYYYPYAIIASYEDSTLEMIPLIATTDYTSIAYLSSFTFSDISETCVSSLNNYLEEYKCPEHVDTSGVISALKELSTTMNYTLTPSCEVYDYYGDKVSKSSSVYTNYFKKLAINYPRKIVKDGYWGENFSGTEAVPVAGGLINIDSRTYLFRDKDDDGIYEDVFEYIESGQDDSYQYWYMYENMSRYIPSLAYSLSNIKKCYPLYDETKDTYTFLSTLTYSESFIEAIFSMCFRAYLVSQAPVKTALDNEDVSLDLSYSYDDETSTLKDMTFTISIVIGPDIYASLKGDYTVVLKGSITDIGSTSIDDETSKIDEDALKNAIYEATHSHDNEEEE